VAEFSQIAAVFFVMLLLGACLWLLRAKGLAAFTGLPARRKPGVLELIERLPLSAQHSLYLVRYRDRELLVATSATACSVVDAPRAAVQQ
jgi:flagellar biogenesis protein FliO